MRSLATAVKRQHEPQRIVGDLLNAEITRSRRARSNTSSPIAKLPLAKDVDDFAFEVRLSMRRWCAISPAAASSPSNATSSWSAEPIPLHNAHLAMLLE